MGESDEKPPAAVTNGTKLEDNHMDRDATSLAIGVVSDKKLENGHVETIDTPTLHRTASSLTLAEEINHLSFRPVKPVNVRVKNLRITADVKSSLSFLPWIKKSGEKKVILDGVSVKMPTGQLMAIIGGSGSGKTTMLNVMARRMAKGSFNVSGSVTYNDEPSLSKTSFAYVMQQDVLIPTLTVRETLLYSAELRLPNSTHEERQKAVEEVIMQLGLKECANTRIGDNEHKGCSGGEKRRCSIGVQLLANPSVLFLDEPTTGLDATSAFQLVKTLKHLARKGRTIITTIHQPRSEIWKLFDRITLLSRGQLLYSGSMANANLYFAAQGHVFPSHENPADFLIDISAIDTRTPEAEESSAARVSALVSAWREYSGDSKASLPLPDQQGNVEGSEEAENIQTQDIMPGKWDCVSFWRQVNVLTRRTFITTYRDPMGIFGSFLEAILMGVVTGLIFFQLDGTLSGIRSRQAALYICSSLQGYLVLLYETYRLIGQDIKVFDRERGEGVIGVVPWMLSRRIARLFTEDIAVPFLFSVITYFMYGFDHDAVQFFRFFLVLLIGQFLAVTFATMAVGVSRDYAHASLVGNLSFTLQSMASGYFIQTNTIPVYIRWVRWITYVFYSFAALASNEFGDKFYACPYDGASDPRCLEYRGDFILVDQLGLKKDWYAIPVIIIASMAVIFYIIAGLLLKFWTVDINISKPRVSDDGDASAGKERLAENRPDVQKIDVVLEDVRLAIKKKGLLKRQNQKLEILKGVSTTFEAGKLNIIMGPSGSGKSTLLNLMARRLKSTPVTRYRPSGRMLFNGGVASDPVIRSLCSYVTQDDDALLPSLTVRETLHFAAGLRLPKWMAKDEKRKKAEDVILKMGLKDCADTVIGSEFVKGISGGERRRVSIAVQILTEPKILLLDEPTSGLDAFTAASILSVLRALADEGRTIISTIHQSRAALFDQFGNVLLLARGGSVAYSGRAVEMLPYFASCGYICPPNTNPADFALDLVTVDLQHESREATSREKVKSLLEFYEKRQSALLQESSASSPPTQHRNITLPAELGRLKREPASFYTAYPILLRRSTITLLRQPPIIFARITQVLGFVIILSLFFSPLKSDYYSVQNRLGVIQQVTSLYFVGMLQNIAAYPQERDAFYREHKDGIYSVPSFFLSYLTLEVPFEIFSSLLFSIFAIFAIGLPQTAKLFFIVTFNAFCVVSAGESVGIIFNTLFTHTGFAINVTSTVLSIGTAMAGVMSIDMPGFLQDLNYLSPLRYLMRNLAPYTLRGFKFTCDEEQRLPTGECVIATGEQALRLYALDRERPEIMVVGLAVTTIVYRVLAYGVLRGRMVEGEWWKRWKRWGKKDRG